MKYENKRKWTLFPFDIHPNTKANIKYAKVIGCAIDSLIANKRVSPNSVNLRMSAEKIEPTDYIYPVF